MASPTTELLKKTGGGLVKALGQKALSTAGDKVGGLTEKLEDIGNGGGGSSNGSSPSKATKATNIIEEIDVGVPIRVAYNQWTEFGEFPSIMKKVENAEAAEDVTIKWKAQIVWSHREWEAQILEQVPDERIVWRSSGNKGHVDGTVTFHEVTPDLTKIIMVLEYYPQGLFERTGNIWRAQARRAKAELKHFQRHVMTRTVLDPDEVEGWRGTIHDGEVVESHEEALEREAEESDEDGNEGGGEQPEDEYDDEGDEEEDEESDEEPEDEYDEEDEYDDEGDEEADEESDEEPEDEYDEEDEYDDEGEEEDEPEDEYDEEDEDEYEDEDEPDEDEEEERPRSRRSRSRRAA